MNQKPISSQPDILLDAHLDIAFNVISNKRDFRKSALQIRQMENKFPGYYSRHRKYDHIGIATAGLPDLTLGRTGVVFATLWVCPPYSPIPAPGVTYHTPQEAYQLAMRQMDYYHRLADENQRTGIIRTEKDLDDLLATWAEGREMSEHRHGMVILMEGADPIREPEQFEEWYERGVRIVGLAWMQTRYSGGTKMPGRITREGRQLLEIMSSLNALLDLSHMAELAFYEALEHYPGPVIASHSNPRHFVNTDRQLSDDMIRRLAERDGVMGMVSYNAFIRPGWKAGRDKKNDVTVNRFLDMIDHICQLTGSSHHVGIGSDMDGGFGWESIPDGFDTHADMWSIKDLLRQRGYNEENIREIMAGNFLRKLRECLPDT